MFRDILAWFTDPMNWQGPQGVPVRLLEHLGLTGIVVLIVALIAFPLGSWTGHTGRGRALVVGTVGAMRAIPTLGLLTVFALWLGIGLGAPVLALVILGIPSLLAATDAGISGVNREVVTAARATGFTEWQILTRVEVPLAASVILGGLRSSILQVVATATLAAYVTDIGLGRYIFAGLKSRDYAEMFAGAVLVMVLALLLEALLAGIQRSSATPAQTRAKRQPRRRIKQ